MKFKKGQVTLSMALLVGSITVFLGIALSFLIASFINSSYGFKASERALAAAKGGVNDAMLRLLRDNTISSSGYNVPLDGINIRVSVEQNVPNEGSATVTSRASVSGYERTIRAIMAVNATTSEISLIDFRLINQ